VMVEAQLLEVAQQSAEKIAATLKL